MAKKLLLDYLIEHGFVIDKDEALKQVLSGNVISENRRFSSIYEKIMDNEQVRFKKQATKYVSRGGDKLASIFSEFNFNIQDKIGLDCGASTGGFTDFLLQNGANKMVTIDVGYGLLNEKLRKDKRVLNFDRINIRKLTKNIFQKYLLSHDNGSVRLPLEFCVADLSFISLKIILPIIIDFLDKGSDILALYKPQFELEKEKIPEGGIVTDVAIINASINGFINKMQEYNLNYIKHLPSKVRGTKGNQEYFIHFKVC